MAGFFYYIAMVAAGGPLYNTYAPLDIYLSMFCHGTLYICGFVTVGTEAYSSKDAPKLVLGVALPIYYVAVAGLVLTTIKGFFKRNQKQYHKFSMPCAAVK